MTKNILGLNTKLDLVNHSVTLSEYATKVCAYTVYYVICTNDYIIIA